MPNISHPSSMKFIPPNGNQMSRSDYNGLVQSAQRVQSFRRGVSNESDIRGDKESSSIRQWVRAVAHDDVPEYSILTIEPGGEAWSLVEPSPLTAQFSLGNAIACVFLAVGDTPLSGTADYYLPVCDFTKPYIFRYDSADGTPAIGNRIGPKYDSYLMSLSGDNLSFTVISDPDTTEFLVWCIKACQSSTVGINIEMFEFQETLHPGHVAEARKLIWNSTTQVYEISAGDTKLYKLFDPEESSFFLPFERTHAMIRNIPDGQGGTFADAEILGEHGLHRKVVVNGDVDCGEIGDVTVQQKAGSRDHPPPKYPTDPTCTIGTSAANLKPCNHHGYRRKILDQEVTTVSYDQGRQSWWFEQEDRGVLVEAILDANMCAEDLDVSVSQAQLMDWKIAPGCNNDPDPAITLAKNSKKLEALAGDTVFLRHFEGKTGNNEWHIVEVEHRVFELLRPGTVNQGDCPDFSIKMRRFSVMTCMEFDNDYIQTNSYAIPVVNDINIDQNCSAMAITWRTVCVFDIIGGGTKYIPMAKVDFLTGVDVGSEGTENCSIDFTNKSACVFMPSSENNDYSINIGYTEVGVRITETGLGTDTHCINLEKAMIPVIGDCPITDPSSEDTIICLKDCEDTPTTVLPEVNTAGSHAVANKQTIPYNTETNSLSNDDITILLPASPEEGEVVAIANNTMEETTVKVDAGTNLVQALSAPYTAAYVSIGGPMLNVTYIARLVGSGIQWRIV